MQIIDRFDESTVHISFPLECGHLDWLSENDEYNRSYLKILEDTVNDKRILRGVYTLYDLCFDLHLEPKSTYAFIGWGKDDEIKLNPYIDENRVIFGFNCRFL